MRQKLSGRATQSQEKPTPELHKDVSIQFFTAADPSFEVGAEVLRREGEMGISLPRQPSSAPYLVRGEKKDYFFAGVDSVNHEVHAHVVARWALLGDVYVGIWIEEGVEYLFLFRLSRRRVAPRRT